MKAPRVSETAEQDLLCPICGNIFTKPEKYSAAQWAKRKTCSKNCQNKLPQAKERRPLLERFEEKYYPEPTSGCWLWTASCNRDRYGKETYGIIGIRGRKTALAHRVSWILFRGKIPDGMILLHRCDNQQCVNPDHLKLGTYADNNADMAAKGRACSGERRAAISSKSSTKWWAEKKRGERP